MSTPRLIEIENLVTRFGKHMVHKDVSLHVLKGEIFGILGGSGSGKTTLLREILLLQKTNGGSLRLFNIETKGARPNEVQDIRRRCGVMFQQGALFSSLTVLENISFPLKEFTRFSPAFIEELALLKLRLVGLSDSTAHLYPAFLSGGMIKRVAIARALAMDPEILFLDEPTAGLDPESAAGIDDLVLELKASLGITIVIVTHDMDTIAKVPDRIVFLGQGHVLGMGTLQEVMAVNDPVIHRYFSGARSRVAIEKIE